MRAQWIEQAREAARVLLYRFGVEKLDHVDVFGFADRLRVRILIVPLKGATAQLIANGRRARILLSDRLSDPAQRRAAVAHELGHYVLGHPPDTLSQHCNPSIAGLVAIDPETIRDFEAEAQAFALELLAPGRAIQTLCHRQDPDLMMCGKIATAAWIPLDYAAIRLAEISTHVCAAVISRGGYIVSVSASRRFAAHLGESLTNQLRPGLSLDQRTVAARVQTLNMPCIAASVPAEAWLGVAAAPLWEDSAPTPSGEMVTMLWAAALESSLLLHTTMRRCGAMTASLVHCAA